MQHVNVTSYVVIISVTVIIKSLRNRKPCTVTSPRQQLVCWQITSSSIIALSLLFCH